ncbi:carbamoyltransferase HypF [Saccharothrix sp. BKS2]|uniref:carbamoyltransferase HypF n=1 Tax=Saccharothrix sp. BKS2 TaxID=3064400 RepID=UPI0039E7FD80
MLTGTAARRRVRVAGVVQGVGYRPFVYKLAVDLGVTGWVLNDPQGVLIEVQGADHALDAFTDGLTALAPPQARVERVAVTRDVVPVPGEDAFTIRASGLGGDRSAIVPADSYVCADCLAELRDPADRRHGYPFINCTNCGPRYSIVRALPYDRAQTTMAAFTMCDPCRAEYEDPLDRRYHAQPNACADCGPRLTATAADGSAVDGPAALDAAAAALARGEVVAIKSVGGFHLAVDARNGAAVARLRSRKRRDAKPFAIMVRDLATAAEVTAPTPGEVELIDSPARPVVLARKRPGALPGTIAPRNPNLGVMLPSAPHHHLLVDRPGLDVLVMTSGNISGFPIEYRNADALARLFAVADLVLHHDRDIEVRVDDSVVRWSSHPELDEPVVSFLRRSRGYAPYPVDTGVPLTPVVAYGAELKTTVALSHGTRVYLSQHIGDLKNDETFESHRRTARHLADLHELAPRVAATDLHPQFRATRFAVGEQPVDEVHRVQHHHAHMASCMAENRVAGPAIGVVFDGAGYGPDETTWGGEFLVGGYADAVRVARLRRLPLLGGDQAVREPIRTGYALALDVFGEPGAAVAAFPALAELDEQRRHVFATMARRGVNAPPASSMGRLFDAVAALLGVCSLAEYEAQGPIELEGLLDRDHTLAAPDPRYRFDRTPVDDLVELDPAPVVRALADDLAAGVGTPELSRRFHSAVVRVVAEECALIAGAPGAPRDVVLSGGVFLNEFLLLNCLVEVRRAGLAAHCQRQVPTNDGGIALGQVLVAHARSTQAGSAQDRSAQDRSATGGTAP